MEERCVYIWINDTLHEPFYVGCGKLNRPGRVYKGARSKLFFDVYNNNKCHYEIIKRNLSPQEAATLERKKKRMVKKYCIINKVALHGNMY